MDESFLLDYYDDYMDEYMDSQFNATQFDAINGTLFDLLFDTMNGTCEGMMRILFLYVNIIFSPCIPTNHIS